MRLCVALHILNTSITEPGPQCNGKTVLSFKAVWHQVCQVGFSALSLISPVHMGSKIALQSGKPRSSPSSLSLCGEQKQYCSDAACTAKDKLLDAEKKQINRFITFVRTSHSISMVSLHSRKNSFLSIHSGKD